MTDDELDRLRHQGLPVANGQKTTLRWGGTGMEVGASVDSVPGLATSARETPP